MTAVLGLRRLDADCVTIVVFTGGSQNSLAAEAAITIASAKPKQIILVARSQSKVEPVIEAIRTIDSSIDVSFVATDLLDNASNSKGSG